MAMAGAPSAATAAGTLCNRMFSPGTSIPRKPIFVFCSISRKTPTRRKNYLRQKILRTLEKPFISDMPVTNPVVPIEPLQENKEPEIQLELEELENLENQEGSRELMESEVSESAQVTVQDNVDLSGKSWIYRYGLWFIGAFVFQTVFAVWVFGSSDSSSNDRNFNGDGKNTVLNEGENDRNKPKYRVLFNGNGHVKWGLEKGGSSSFIYVDEDEMEQRIKEIQVMAREAREKERLESKKNGLDSDEDDDKLRKSVIEKEVETRLVKLGKKLDNTRDKMPVTSVGNVQAGGGKVEPKKSELDSKDGNRELVFKKKYKFKGLPSDPGKKPKGFTGSDNQNTNLEQRESWDERVELKNVDGGENGMELIGDQQKLDMVDGKTARSYPMHSEEGVKSGLEKATESTRSGRKKVVKERSRKTQGKHKTIEKPKVVNGSAREKIHQRPEVQEVKSRNSRVGAAKSRESGSRKGVEVVDTRSVNKWENKESESETDFWWLNLPYVLGILMRRGHEGKGGQGLYTLRSTSNGEAGLSYTVAFEDHGDATNFCYLLETFFEDLGDFSANLVPLSVKDLSEAVKSNDTRAIVVKKGQLPLYAGQPLADAEVALRTLAG